AVSVTDDALSEGTETILMQLGSLNETTGGFVTLGLRTVHSISIADNDIDLRLTGVGSAPTVVAGSGVGNLIYKLTLTNVGLTDGTDVTIADQLMQIGRASY